MNDSARAMAARCHRVLEPLHSMIYFAPEAERAYTSAGLEPGRMGYFASRSAALGAVGPGAVAATFCYFNPVGVAAVLPRAWTLASPEAVLEARFGAAPAALRRLLGDLADVEWLPELVSLVREAAESCTPEGRPLYAAHADLDWPSDPLTALWHGCSLLREHRGDSHVAVLVGHDLAGLPGLVTHTATGAGFTREMALKRRGWSEKQWAAAEAELRERGLLDGSGALTAEGAGERERVEDETNAAAAGPWRRLGDEKAARVYELARGLGRAVVEAGAYPRGLFAADERSSAG